MTPLGRCGEMQRGGWKGSTRWRCGEGYAKAAFFTFVVAGTFTVSTSSVIAQPLPESLWQQALEHSPRLAAARLAVEAAAQSEDAVGLWPDLEFQAGVFTRPMEFMMGDQRLDLQAMQMLPQASMFRAQREELAAMTQIRRASQEMSVRKLRRDLTELWVLRSALEEEIRLVNEAITLVGQMQTLAEARVASGGRQSDLIRLQLRRTGLEAELDRLRLGVPGLEEAVWSLVGDSSRSPVPYAERLRRPRMAGSAVPDPAALADHPSVRMPLSDANAASARSDMAAAEKRPMMGLGLQYMPIAPRRDAAGMSTSGNDMLMPMVSLSIPMSRGKRDAKATAARLESRASEAESKDQLAELTGQWARLQSEFRQAEARADLADEQVRISQLLYEASISEYESGQTSMEALLEIQESWVEYKKNRLAAISELHLVLSRLEELQPNLPTTYEND